ncbi:MAG TPA: hypothetical protein VG106_15305, partial [Vicinamibacterales bacterium]|nr:hypothetical protein [Vicinamibacterales bacterium]
MLRILRAFLWLRWRVFVNSLERTGARDTLERFSIAMEQITPLVAILLLVPSMVGAAGLGAAAGYALVSAASRPFLFDLVRYLLVAAMFLSLVGPIAMPAGERTNAVRLLLLPISRATLYVAHIASTFVDPWILLVLPMVALLPAGLASGGSFGAAAVASAAAVLLIAALVGLSALATSLLHLLVRDRRRGELLALAFILVLPIVGMLPAIFEAKRDEAHDREGGRPRETPAWVQTARRAASYAPSELYVTAVRGAAVDVIRPLVRPLAALAAVAL